ncbi:MAG: hypothetical protein [Bacteriophage sp.]|nr:MAG: hypothetical protein [Bacteriophage sp.]
MTCHSNEHGATDLRVGSTDVINNSFVDVINNSFVDVIASARHGNAHHQH